MRKFVSMLCAAAISATSVVTTTTLASAATYQVPRTITDASSNNVVDAQYRRGGPRAHRGGHRSHRGFHRRGGHGYYNGHRGYRQARRGYRQYNGYWFPPAAFIAGAIVGGAVASPPPAQYRPRYNQGMSRSHVDWCYAQYRSYRASDNSFQPYNGPRRQCRSPYG